jgi:hypothetical protein
MREVAIVIDEEALFVYFRSEELEETIDEALEEAGIEGEDEEIYCG